MKKVKLKQVMITVPVEATEDDYDVELQSSLYQVAQQATKALMRVSDACNLAVVEQLELGAVPDEHGGANVMIAGAPGSNSAKAQPLYCGCGDEVTWNLAFQCFEHQHDRTHAPYEVSRQRGAWHQAKAEGKTAAAQRYICSRCQRDGYLDSDTGLYSHVITDLNRDHRPPSLISIQAGPPVSQEDPVINTAVSDRDMGMVDDLSLEELRERPERTRRPPRPRANSWRHENG